MPLPHFIGDLGRRAVALVGTSGCGKTTLPRIISGIERATGGKVTLRGNAVTGPRADVGVELDKRRPTTPTRSPHPCQRNGFASCASFGLRRPHPLASEQ